MVGSWRRASATLLVFALIATAAVPIGGQSGGFLPQDDAGSGRDAPDEPIAEVWISPGQLYSGNKTGLTMDLADWYAFESPGPSSLHLRSFPGETCFLPWWRVADASGDEQAMECIVGADGSIEYRTQLEAGGLHFIGLRDTLPQNPKSYVFAFALGEDAPPFFLSDPLPPGPGLGVDECPGTSTPDPGTSGRGDPHIPSLTWAALRTGFRAVVAWNTDIPTTGSLSVLGADGQQHILSHPGMRTEHVYVIDELPIGKILCFEARHSGSDGSVTSERHALRLRNAMNAYDEDTGTYTLNLLVLVNEDLIARDLMEAGINRYARYLNDATDGHVRSGQVMLLYGAVDHHNSGEISCAAVGASLGPFVVPEVLQPYAATCRTHADYVWVHEMLPTAAATTWRDAIQTRHRAVYMNSIHTAQPSITGLLFDLPHEIGHVMLHEAGHYVFGMPDLYGFSPQNCNDLENNISVMGSSRTPREFDDDATPCPDADQIPGYIPSWNFLRERFPTVPDRPDGSIPGPFDAGDRHHLAVFATTPGV